MYNYLWVTALHSDRTSKVVYPQIASQILQKDPKELRCHSRAWKVNLMGEGADDAGGVFDETVAQMCEVRGCEWVEVWDVCVCACAHINEKHM